MGRRKRGKKMERKGTGREKYGEEKSKMAECNKTTTLLPQSLSAMDW
jgi:hypothetical protein